MSDSSHDQDQRVDIDSQLKRKTNVRSELMTLSAPFEDLLTIDMDNIPEESVASNTFKGIFFRTLPEY
jgi:hypothetical protein